MGFPSEQAVGIQEKDNSQLGWWVPGGEPPRFLTQALGESLPRFRELQHIVQHPENGALGIGLGGSVVAHGQPGAYRRVGSLPPLYPEWLGNPEFCRVHSLRFPYLAGAMATGIGSEEVVIEMARAGMMGFFGSAVT